MYGFAFIGEMIGFTGSMAAAIGTAAVVTFFVSIISLASASKARAARRTGQYTATQPDSPQREHGIPPSTISVPPPPYSPPTGVSNAPPGLPNSLGLKYKWGRNVQLNWEKLKYDKKLYELYGFEILELRYDGASTQPYVNLVERLSPNTTKWRGRIEQTYQFSTQGDIAGYRVDALFMDRQSPYRQFIRIGETAAD